MPLTLAQLIPLVRAIHGSDPLSDPFGVLAEVHDRQVTPAVAEPTGTKVDIRTANRAKKVAALLAAPDALEKATGVASSAVLEEKFVTRAEVMLGQLLLGSLAEQAFEKIYKDTLGSTELKLEDQRESRNDTDYRVLNGGGRQLFRMNIKFHGARFRKAEEMVGLAPEDCFPLATYKIFQGLQKQEAEALPYVFAVISSPISAIDVGKQIPKRYIQLAALAHASKEIKRKRKLEERIVEHLTTQPEPAFAGVVQDLRNRLAAADWRVLSARRANQLLTEKLFERVFAVRIRSFNRSYRNAELDMHFSLADDMTPIQQFLKIFHEKGPQGITTELERGSI